MTVDRAALIETIAEREWRWYWDHRGGVGAVEWSEVEADAAEGWRERARAIAAVALPVIADAIEAQAEAPRRQSGGYSEYVTYREAARLVRSLLGDTDGDR